MLKLIIRCLKLYNQISK